MSAPSLLPAVPAPVAEPKLAPPGAGLPGLELFIGRLRFALRRATESRESANARFAQERERIRRLLQSLTDEEAGRRILIKRLRGLEDSSRFWSVWMTLDHLRIVHSGMIRLIGALSRGIILPGAASTAAVKPRPDVDARVVSEYEKACDDLVATVAAVENLQTTVKYSHPWFGLLDAAGWHVMAAWHIGLHRHQIERIVAGLRPGE